MIRRHGITGAIVLVTLLGVGFPILLSSGQVPVLISDADLTPPAATGSAPASDAQIGDSICAAQEAVSTPEVNAATCSRCPPDMPRCSQDRDCDKFCGGRVTGSCIRINSCYKCCACAT